MEEQRRSITATFPSQNAVSIKYTVWLAATNQFLCLDTTLTSRNPHAAYTFSRKRELQGTKTETTC